MITLKKGLKCKKTKTKPNQKNPDKQTKKANSINTQNYCFLDCKSSILIVR